MQTYLVLLHESTEAVRPELSPEEMQALIARYKAWGKRLREAGRLLGSNKLEDGTGRVLRAESGQVRITDGPFTETKDVLGGYYLIQAESLEEAAEFCKTSPHLDLGAVEVRRIEVV